VIFIEATAFTKHVYTYLTDDEFLGLQSFLLRYPESGKIVSGSGGVRKRRTDNIPAHVLRQITEEIKNV
jgi:hypothetical protein